MRVRLWLIFFVAWKIISWYTVHLYFSFCLKRTAEMEKDKVFSIKNFIKDDQKNVRLASLRLPRDLSLGGTKPKRVFTPNLNVVRKKDQPKEIKKVDPKRRENHVRNKINKANFDKQKYIQSSGVFSEGGEEVKRTFYNGERSASVRDNDTISGMVLPKINLNHCKVNRKKEDNILDKLVGCDEMDQDVKMDLEPFDIMNNMTMKRLQKLEIKIKKEDDLKHDTQALINNRYYPVPRPFCNEKMYNDDYPALTVLKLPNSFAGKGLSDDPNVKQVFDYPLNSMLDGQIGKLCIRRSGKIEVHIGRIKYNLEDIDFSLGKSEVVNFIEKGSEIHEPGLTVLGEVNNWFTLVPDWNTLSVK